MTKQELVDAYTNCLEEAVRQYPTEYVWPIATAPVVALKMVDAMFRGSFNKDGRAIKLLCKRYSIPYTYAGIKSFLQEVA